MKTCLQVMTLGGVVFKTKVCVLLRQGAIIKELSVLCDFGLDVCD
jgi:hypothetical protein